MIAETALVLCLALAAAPPSERPPEKTGSPAGNPALLARIEGLLTLGRIAEARAQAEEALRKNPSDPALLVMKARCLLEGGDFPACEAVLSQLLAGAGSWPAPERARLLLRLAEARLLQGDLDGAASAAEESLASEGEDLAAAAAGIFFRARRYRRALPLLERAIARASEDRFLRYARGVALSRQGSFREALNDLALAVEDPSLRVEARYERGMALGKLGEPRRAAEELLLALEEDPWHAGASYLLGQELIRLKKSRLAAHLFRFWRGLQEAEGLSSRDHHLAALGRAVEAGLERARKWEQLGRYEKAIAEFAALARSSGGAAAARAEAEFWMRMGLPGEARRAIDRAGTAGDPALAEVEARLPAALPPGDVRALLLDLAREARARGQAEEAYRRLRLLVALEPRSEEALRLLSQMHQDPSELLPRIHFLRRLLEVRPDDAAARTALEEARRPFREDG